MNLIKRFLKQAQRGIANLKTIISIVIGVVVLSVAIPVLWPMIQGSGTAIAAMTPTGAGTSFIQSFWPLLIIIAAIAIGVGILYFIVKQVRA